MIYGFALGQVAFLPCGILGLQGAGDYILEVVWILPLCFGMEENSLLWICCARWPPDRDQPALFTAADVATFSGSPCTSTKVSKFMI